ncbi:MAG: DUF4124 domain-containing protein [Bdellovibrionales bacterium]|nr:DUF4124 domain-containing protein [Bdellovibrionales bacterium]
MLHLLAHSALAGDIYTWTDSEGRVHFSTSPHSPGAKRADLPELQHEDLDEKIQAIRESTPPNCLDHGGIDCSAGPDSDGSVVCLDGFREALLPHRFACSEADLSVTEVFIVDNDGQVVSELERADALAPVADEQWKNYALVLSLRNNSAVAAAGMEVAFALPGREFSPATGPEGVPAYGAAEYRLPLAGLKNLVNLRQIAKTDYKVRCTNCRATRRRIQ